MAKKYELSLERMYDEDGPSGYFSKGHGHDEAEFRAAVSKRTGEPVGFFQRFPVAQTWWRCVPGGDSEFAVRFHEATAGARGAFPVTIMEVN